MSSPVLNYKLESIFIIMYPEGPSSDRVRSQESECILVKKITIQSSQNYEQQFYFRFIDPELIKLFTFIESYSIDNIILYSPFSLQNTFAFSQNYTTYSHFKYFLLLESIIQFHCVKFAFCFSYEDQRLRRSKKITMMYHHLSY